MPGIQYGEVADRLRRALGLRGPLPTTLDLNASPVVQIADASGLPYALDPSYGAGGIDITAGAFQNVNAIVNQGPEGSVFIVDQITIACGATGHEFEISRSGTLIANVPADSVSLADTSSQARPGVTGRDLPVLINNYSTEAVVTVGSICEIGSAPSLTTMPSLVLPVKHVLRRGEVCYVKITDASMRILLGVSGRFYSNVGDTGA